MAATPPSDSKPAGDDRNLVAADATSPFSLDEKLYFFWQKYRAVVLGICVLILAVIIGKGAWDYMARQKERQIQQAYAATSTPEQLRAFSTAHQDHVLGGVAQLRIADEAYAAGKFVESIAAYDKVVSRLGDGPLSARARLGRAVAKVKAGNVAEASNDLRQLANDANQFKAIRTEAAYHLTSLAVEAGNMEEAQKLTEQLMQIDPTSPWTQRGLELRSTLPAAKPAADATTPQSDGTPNVQFTLPGR